MYQQSEAEEWATVRLTDIYLKVPQPAMHTIFHCRANLGLLHAAVSCQKRPLLSICTMGAWVRVAHDCLGTAL